MTSIITWTWIYLECIFLVHYQIFPLPAKSVNSLVICMNRKQILIIA